MPEEDRCRTFLILQSNLWGIPTNTRTAPGDLAYQRYRGGGVGQNWYDYMQNRSADPYGDYFIALTMGWPDNNPDTFLGDQAWQYGGGDQDAYDRIQRSDNPTAEFIALVNEGRFWYYCSAGMEDRNAIRNAESTEYQEKCL